MWVYLYPSNTETPLKDAYIWIPSPTSIVLDKSSISLTTIWQTEQLTATIEPTISDHSITWSSDDTTVATVSTTWLVTCVTPWDCTITATTVNWLTATCTVWQWWLPSAYQEVEYIETTGTQWINTNLFSWTNIQTEVKIWITDTRMNMPIFWCYTNYSTPRLYYHLTPYSNAWYFWYNGSEWHWWSFNFVVWQTYEIAYNDENGYLNVDWNNIVSVSGTNWYPWSTLWIAQRWTNHTWWEAPRYKYYYFKMYNKTTQQYERDMIPCYRIADTVIWMYDVANDVFYTNSWSWTFTKWPDVN